jgi:hypothetical protein
MNHTSAYEFRPVVIKPMNATLRRLLAI